VLLRRRAALAALGAIALASCAVVPPSPTAFPPQPDVAFELAGRLSARRSTDGAAANFRWQHGRARDEFLLATPMGSTVARLEGREGRVRLERADGNATEANDWEALTAQVLGAPLPVRGLAWWVRASPHPGSAYSAEPDATGRLAVLRQDGWEIVYSYRDDEREPVRLVLAYPEVEVRLVIDERRPLPSAAGTP
jgi:outer membrane lipoprotein LolB